MQEWKRWRSSVIRIITLYTHFPINRHLTTRQSSGSKMWLEKSPFFPTQSWLLWFFGTNSTHSRWILIHVQIWAASLFELRNLVHFKRHFRNAFELGRCVHFVLKLKRLIASASILFFCGKIDGIYETTSTQPWSYSVQVLSQQECRNTSFRVILLVVIDFHV